MEDQKRIWRWGIQLALIGGVSYGLFHYEDLLDQYALATFHAPTEVAQIEPRLNLTTGGRAILYRAQPQVDGKAAFNGDCETSKGELELGCYYRGRIYVLRIENSSLAPEMDTVLAHELLHAAWRRLSDAERTRLTTELERVYGQLNDNDLRQRMAGYAKSEPGEEANELHSILATEYTALSPMLEDYYKRYFTDRARIVAAHSAYKAVFDSRRQELERELGTIRSQKAQLAVINRQLDSYKASGRIEQYNALVPRQNALVDDINARIAQYQKGVDEYNALSQSLDSQQITDTETSVQ